MTNAAVAGLGTILGVWAHPDDEAYLTGGLMAEARAAGNRVVVVTATAGELGTNDPETWPPERLAEQRRSELAASLAALGVTEHRFLGYADGGCAGVPAEEGAARVAEILREVRPDTVVTFGPDGMTGHPDHQAVCAWTTEAWRRADRPGRLWYATTTPGFHERWGELNERIGLWGDVGAPTPTEPDRLAFVLSLTDGVLDRKLESLRTQWTQTGGLIEAVGDEQYRRWWDEEAFTSAH